MPFKNREDYNEYMRKYRADHPDKVASYREGQKHELLKRKNRFGYLESEVARLQKCLEVAQRGCTMP